MELSVDAESQATARATATIEREGRGQVTAEVIRAAGGFASSPFSGEPIRAGVPAPGTTSINEPKNL